MLMVSEQQTYTKLRLAPEDFVKMLDENPDKALEYITQLQAQREVIKERKTKEKDPNAPKSSNNKRGRKPLIIDLSKL